VEAFGLGLITEEELPGVGADEEALKAGGEAEGAILGAGDVDIGCELLVEEIGGEAIDGDGLIQGEGMESGFEAGAAQQGLLGEDDALDGEEFLELAG
jgi:hypothetical protein